MKKFSKKSKGVTLLELMVTVAIGGALLAYGIPAYHDFSVRQKMSNDVNDWVGDMTLARTTAVKMGQRVVIQSMGGWKNGWQVYHDVDGNNLFDPAVDNLIRMADEVKGDMVMDATTSGSGGTIGFDNLGSLTGPALLNGGFQMTFSHNDVAESISATVSPSGLIATKKL